MYMKHALMVIMLAVMAAAFPACQTTEVVAPGKTATTNYRPIGEEAVNPDLGTPTVKDFVSACDLMARDLVMSSVVQTADRPIVVEIKPIENKTGQDMDLTIYPQTIRGYINKQGVRRIAFRDETARSQIVPERIEQEGSPVVVHDSSTTTTSKSVAGNKYSLGMPPDRINDKSKRTTDRTAEVSSKVADVDYFLNGLIYATSESSGRFRDTGFRYFQFQFRLTNARTGIVEWENMYQIKLAGDLPDEHRRRDRDSDRDQDRDRQGDRDNDRGYGR